MSFFVLKKKGIHLESFLIIINDEKVFIHIYNAICCCYDGTNKGYASKFQ